MSAETTERFDWTDADARRNLCTALSLMLREHAPKDAHVLALAAETPGLTLAEHEAIRAYFGADKRVGDL